MPLSVHLEDYPMGGGRESVNKDDTSEWWGNQICIQQQHKSCGDALFKG